MRATKLVITIKNLTYKDSKKDIKIVKRKVKIANSQI